MATRRKAVTRSRITTRSSKAKQQPEQATTASQTSTITNTTTTTRLILSSSSETCSASSPVKKYSVEIKNEEEDGCWSTPKAKRFRIPEIESCPPAPKKQRGGGACDDASINCSMRRSSIPFFTPPELADFFFRVSVPNMSAA